MNSNASIKIINEKFHVFVVLFQPGPHFLTADLTEQRCLLIFFSSFLSLSAIYLYNRMALGPLFEQ